MKLESCYSIWSFIVYKQNKQNINLNNAFMLLVPCYRFVYIAGRFNLFVQYTIQFSSCFPCFQAVDHSSTILNGKFIMLPLDWRVKELYGIYSRKNHAELITMINFNNFLVLKPVNEMKFSKHVELKKLHITLNLVSFCLSAYVLNNGSANGKSLNKLNKWMGISQASRGH